LPGNVNNRPTIAESKMTPKLAQVISRVLCHEADALLPVKTIA